MRLRGWELLSCKKQSADLIIGVLCRSPVSLGMGNTNYMKDKGVVVLNKTDKDRVIQKQDILEILGTNVPNRDFP